MANKFTHISGRAPDRSVTRARRNAMGLCRDCGGMRDTQSSRCGTCRTKHSEQMRNLAIKYKDEVYSAYGGYKCSSCGDTHAHFLTIDHVTGGGKQHVRELGGAGIKLYSDIRKSGFPTGAYQILCYNCNMKKSVKAGGSKKAAYRREIKRTVMLHYGNACSCCGIADSDILCVDHVSGGGQKHRLEISRGRTMSGASHATYIWLLKNNLPDGFRILCHNCNNGSHLNGGRCPHGSDR